MAERPTRRPRFGYDAPSGQVAEPLAGVAAAGFAPGQRPPAQWINYLLHFTTAWVDYLAGPGWGAWVRTTHGGSAPVFTAVAGVAVDTDDTRATGGRYRYVIAGTKAGPTPILAVSRTGREWIERSAPSAMTVMSGAFRIGDRFLVWGTATGPTFKVWHTEPDTPSVASAISADDATQWVEVTDLAGYVVRGMAWNGAGETWAAVGSASGSVTLARSTDDGETWPYIAGFDPGVTSGAINTDVTWDDTRSLYFVATDEGDVFPWDPVALAAGTVVVLSGISTTANVRLRAGGGVLLAWASVDRSGSALGASLLWRSDDGAATWDAVTLPSAIGATLTDVTYADGVWVATTTAAPYLWRSDDGGATWERVALPLGEESSWALHRAVYADGAVTATGLTWTVATTRAAGLAPDASRVYSPEPGYLADAGYLRGRRIAATAPTDGQGLVWDATGGAWGPGAAGMANPMTTLGDSIRGGASGAPERVAIGSTGQVWTVVGGVGAWATPAAGGVDTSLQTPSDGGWTQTGTGTATASGGALSLVATGTNTVGMRRTLPASPYLYGVELLVRVDSTALPAGGNYSLDLGIENDDATRGYRVRLTQGGSVEDRGNTAGSWGFNGSTNTPGLDWDNGTTWLKLVCTQSFIGLYWGTGVGTAEPTSWTRNSYVYTPDSTLLRDGLLNRFHVQITRASGTGDLEVTAHPRSRSLLGAPA